MQSFEEVKTNLENINNKYNKLCELLTYEEVLLDKKLFLNFQKQKQKLEVIALKYQKFLILIKEQKELEEIIKNIKDEEKSVFVLELESSLKEKENLQNDLLMLLNNFNAENQNIIVEIISNKSDDYKQVLHTLQKGYISFCNINNIDYKLIEEDNKLKIEISGLNIKEIFKDEVGVLKSLTKLNDYCQVFVYDNFINDFNFNEEDVIISTCRSSGAGGQHINTTDSSIKATHKKTSITAVSQDERSQIQNKQKALERLKEKLEKYYLELSNKQIEKEKKEQLIKIKNNFVVKDYDFENGKIVKANKQQIFLNNFLLGKEI